MARTKEELEAIGRRIELVRWARGMSRSELVDAMDVKRQSVWQWETGANEPGQAAMDGLVRVLGCTRDYLIDGNRAGLPHELAILLPPEK